MLLQKIKSFHPIYLYISLNLFRGETYLRSKRFTLFAQTPQCFAQRNTVFRPQEHVLSEKIPVTSGKIEFWKR